jgi:hypothetical protein
MQYRLRTLLIISALGPPAIAALWLIPQRLPPDYQETVYFVLCPIVLPLIVASGIAIPLVGVWAILFVVKLIMDPENRKPPAFRFTLRDVLWAIAVVVLGVAWWSERSRRDRFQWESEYLQKAIDREGYVAGGDWAGPKLNRKDEK